MFSLCLTHLLFASYLCLHYSSFLSTCHCLPVRTLFYAYLGFFTLLFSVVLILFSSHIYSVLLVLFSYLYFLPFSALFFHFDVCLSSFPSRYHSVFMLRSTPSYSALYLYNFVLISPCLPFPTLLTPIDIRLGSFTLTFHSHFILFSFCLRTAFST